MLASSVDLSDRRFYLSRGRDRSRFGRGNGLGKSINKQVFFLPLTHNNRRKGKWGSLKECNISRHKVMSKSGTITPISFLNTRISHKDTL